MIVMLSYESVAQTSVIYMSKVPELVSVGIKI